MCKLLAEQPGEFDPRKAFAEAKAAARGIVKARVKSFGCARHAAHIDSITLEAMVARYR